MSVRATSGRPEAGTGIRETMSAMPMTAAYRQIPNALTILRFVLVPGLTDDAADIARIAKFGASLGNVARVDVLPFHQMGKYKWKQLGMNYTLNDTDPPDQALIEKTIGIFRAAGLKAV